MFNNCEAENANLATILANYKMFPNLQVLVGLVNTFGLVKHLMLASFPSVF